MERKKEKPKLKMMYFQETKHSGHGEWQVGPSGEGAKEYGQHLKEIFVGLSQKRGIYEVDNKPDY